MSQQLRNMVRRLKRNAGSFYYINKNKLLGRSFVAHLRTQLFVETVTYCNLQCRFCTYPKNLHPRAVMDDALFRSCVDQAAAMGFEAIFITPTNGDPFMDKNILGRLRYIENSSIKRHGFYSNFIGADAGAIRELLALPKLSYLEISIYGHDLESFQRITGRGPAQYARLLENLQAFVREFPARRSDADFIVGMRTYRSFSFSGGPQSELTALIEQLRALGVAVGVNSQVDDWGGDIGPEDIGAIDMDLTEGRHLYKKGACSLPFDSLQITPDGRVNACACRDTTSSLNLGHLSSAPLSEILSSRNDRWMKLIDDHEAGRFSPVCRACGFYQSIYDERRVSGPGHVSKQTYLDAV